MAQLIVGSLDESIVKALGIRAAENGRSAEAEHREILKAALEKEQDRKPVKSFKEMLLSMPYKDGDPEFERIGGSIRDVDLED